MTWPRSLVLALAATTCLSWPAAAAPASFSAKVVGVSGGDTITVRRDDKKQVRVRLYGIDSPEKGQAFGQRAKQLTTKLVFGKRVHVEVKEAKDRHGRLVGVVFVAAGESFDHYNDGSFKMIKVHRCLNHALLKAGLAWWYRERAPKNTKLAKLEAAARAAKRGLWADKAPLAPWDWRQGKRRSAAPPKWPWSKDRVCRRNSDCEIGWRPCGYRHRPCRDTWREAVNRATNRRYKRSWATKRPACGRRMPCPRGSARGRWLGDKVACVKRQCVIRRASGGGRSSLARRVGQRVRLQGRAAEAKAGSVIIPKGTREPVYVRGLHGWGKLLGKQVVVDGVLRLVKMIPDPVRDKSGAISQGAVGRQYIIDNARWSEP